MRRKLTWLALAVFVGAVAYGGRVLATDASRFSAVTLAKASLGDIDVNNFTLPASIWQARLQTRGQSDLYVQSNTWAAAGGDGTPGGTTGWHTHPGHSLIIVTEGTVTAYDESCTKRDYPTGSGFVDQGGDHVHLLRNEQSVPAQTIAVQLVPAGATRRINADAPPNCPVY